MSRRGLPRVYVQENPMFACTALAPVSPSWQAYTDPADATTDEVVVRGPYLGPLLRVPHEGGSLSVPTAKPVVDIYYSLLSRAEPGAEGTFVVRASYYSVCQDHSWVEGGTANRKIDRVVQYLDTAKFTISSPKMVTGRDTLPFGPVFSTQQGPDGLVVQVAPDVLEAGSHEVAARIDVELLSRLANPMQKAGYRLIAGLKALEVEQIALEEFLDRSGSFTKKRRPSEVQKPLKGLWDTLVAYGYLREVPALEKDRRGRYRFFFKWGTPAELPAGEDELFLQLRAEDVSPDQAVRMLREDARRAESILEGIRLGALGEPKTTVAAQIVGVFNTRTWDVEDSIARHRAAATRGDAPVEVQSFQNRGPAPTAEFDFSDAGWEEFSKREAGPDVLRDVTIAMLRHMGRADEIGKLNRGENDNLIHRAYDWLGWKGIVDVLLRVYTRRSSVRSPVGYIVNLLRKELDKCGSPGSSTSSGGKPTKLHVAVESFGIEAARPGSRPTSAEPTEAADGGEAPSSRPGPAEHAAGEGEARTADVEAGVELEDSLPRGFLPRLKMWKKLWDNENRRDPEFLLTQVLPNAEPYRGHPEVERLCIDLRERAERMPDSCSKRDSAA